MIITNCDSTPTASFENRSLADEECAVSFVGDTIVPQLTLCFTRTRGNFRSRIEVKARGYNK